MEQIALFDVLRRRALLIIALSIVATVAGYAFSFLVSDRYTASALVLVRPQQPIKMSGTPPDVRRRAPQLGEHTDEILREAGYSVAEIERLRERQVIV